MPKNRPYLLLFLSLFCFVGARSGGIEVSGQGQKQAGMGQAGTGTLLDASSLLFNPGAVTFLDTVFTFNFSVSAYMSRVTYRENSPGTYQAEALPQATTPFSGFMAWKKKPSSKWSFGFAMYSPYGNKIQWDGSWKGQFIVQESNLIANYFQPTLSYKLTDKLGIGAGFVYATGIFEMQKAIPVQFADGHYASAVFHSSLSGIGYNGGLFYKCNDRLTLGFNYRSQVNLNSSNGTATFDTPLSLSGSYPATTFTTSLPMPYVISLGAGYRIRKLLLAFDANFTGWSAFDTLHLHFTDHTAALADIRSPRKYTNSYTFRAGAQYALSSTTLVRLGTYYDNSPVPSGYVTPDAPDAPRIGFTAGATYRMGKRVCVDCSFLFEQGLRRSDINMETGFAGTFQNRILQPGIGLQVIL